MQELMDLIKEQYGYLDPDYEPPSSLPDALAQLKAAKAEGANLLAVCEEIARLEEKVQPLLELRDSIGKENVELKKENKALRAELAELKSQSKTATPRRRYIANFSRQGLGHL
jgi:cell division protein FtsB